MSVPRIEIVTGSRHWTDAATVASVLWDAAPDLVVHGACPTGADEIADLWCWENSVECKPFPANWDGLGLRAGPIRNGRMLRAYPTARVRAFPLGGPGTRDCVAQARALGREVFVYAPGGALVAAYRGGVLL
jgi:hypothetical protein